MIIWVNGPFGGGKTTTAQLLHQKLDGSLVFDPEEVGFMLRSILPGREKDFQDLAPWRPLVAATALELHAFNDGRPLIAPMTLLNRPYAHEIFTRIQATGIPLHHLLVHVDTDVLTQRIAGSREFPDDEERSEKVRNFRRRKIDAYAEACTSWLAREAEVINASHLTPEQVAEQALKLLDLP
ncbi:AAA family ATPase [Streptomyces roseifaciens]|uniref:AAA family ATPase n=1 Tax=Streptomyces roseifaciens TaxID=1488406 RepID=UPI000717F004|nr:AAA family ATPase [Streptomyces roseifaciens]